MSTRGHYIIVIFSYLKVR